MLTMNVEHMALSFGRDWYECKNMLDKLKNMDRWSVTWARQVRARLWGVHATSGAWQGHCMAILGASPAL